MSGHKRERREPSVPYNCTGIQISLEPYLKSSTPITQIYRGRPGANIYQETLPSHQLQYKGTSDRDSVRSNLIVLLGCADAGSHRDRSCRSGGMKIVVFHRMAISEERPEKWKMPNTKLKRPKVKMRSTCTYN